MKIVFYGQSELVIKEEEDKRMLMSALRIPRSNEVDLDLDHHLNHRRPMEEFADL